MSGEPPIEGEERHPGQLIAQLGAAIRTRRYSPRL
jgi:hypothetical protein